jgi:hypothetical protein
MRVGMTRAITLLVGVAALGLALPNAMPARAQGVTTAPPAVAECLCAQRAVSVFDRDMRAAGRRHEQAHGDLSALSRQVEEARGRVNTNNRSDIEAFKALLERRDAAAVAVEREDQRYAAIGARYNNAVERNNAACSGRLFDQEEVESVKANLVCPRP